MTSSSIPVVGPPWGSGGDAFYHCSFGFLSPLTFIALFHSGFSADMIDVHLYYCCFFNGMFRADFVSMFLTAAAKEREKAQKAAAQKKAPQTPSTSGYNTPSSQAMSPVGSPTKSSKKAGASVQPMRKSGATTPARTNSGGLDYMMLDLSAANLQPREDESLRVDEPVPRIAMDRAMLLLEARRELQASAQGAKKGVSLVVIGKSRDVI